MTSPTLICFRLKKNRIFRCAGVVLILQKWKFLKTSSTFLNTCLLIHVLLTSQISREVVESGSKCVHVFCGLVDYGGITLLALRSPRAQKSIHICDPDSTTRGIGGTDASAGISSREWIRRWCRTPRLRVRPWRTDFSHLLRRTQIASSILKIGKMSA